MDIQPACTNGILGLKYCACIGFADNGVAMVGFVINLFRLLRSIWFRVKSDEEFRVLIFVLGTLIASGTIFYPIFESWELICSLYFSVMTMSAIDYGDLQPTTTLPKLFTITYVLLSIGVFVAVVARIVAAIFDKKRESKNPILGILRAGQAGQNK